MLFRAKASRRLYYFGAVIGAGLAHIGVLAFWHNPLLLSNAIQLLSGVLAIGLCFWRARSVSDAYFRGAWMQLGIAFLLWTAAQSYFLGFLLWMNLEPTFPSTADFLWLLFAFPMLLVIVTRRSRAKWEWIDWLDAAQASIFFCVLFALVFLHPATLTVSFAYEIQSLALLLAWALRYSSISAGPERIFFRNLGAFLLAFALFSSIGYRRQENGTFPGGWIDLCWSFPFLLFCSFALLTDQSNVVQRRRKQSLKVASLNHLHGLSSLGLSVMSLCAATALALHRPSEGRTALAVAFLLFVVRTSAREAQTRVAHDTLKHSVFHDELTGLANRAQLVCELALCHNEQSLSNSRIALLVIDFDRFKIINDGLGHPFGDRLLIQIASILKASVGSEDLVVRLEGDEFAVLMECIGPLTPLDLGAAIVLRFRKPIAIEGRVLHVTASVGIAVGESNQAPEELLRQADCAMYTAKKRGRNQQQVFDPTMVEDAHDDLLVENDLRQAIDSGGLTCHFQPIYSLSQQAIVGFEALSRWNHATRGMMSPATFIPLAEETGLIIQLGKQVMLEACWQVKRWNQIFGCSFTISVNVSVKQFSDPDLLQSIKDSLEKTKLNPSLLCIEITESALFNATHNIEQVLIEARALGIRVSLDDFGTVYSSLSYLLRLPFDIIKIDRSFVQTLDKDAKRAELVQVIVQLARNLDKTVIAEGVETGGECLRLEQMHCDLVQGYLFSKPLPADQIEQVLSRRMDLTESAFAAPDGASLAYPHVA